MRKFRCALDDGGALILETNQAGQALISIEIADGMESLCVTLDDYAALSLADALINVARHYTDRDMLSDVI